LLEITFFNGAKFVSFRRFPLSFRKETRSLLLVCQHFELPKDVRLLLVKYLSFFYERKSTQREQVFVAENSRLKVEVFKTVTPRRVMVHLYSLPIPSTRKSISDSFFFFF
jgi:hypothetical protein